MKNKVLTQISALAEMDMDALKKLWSELYDIPPPGINRTYMIRRLTYRIQEIAYGGLPEDVQKKLHELRRSVPTKINPKRNCLPPAGTNLVREYQGIEHRVTVLHDDPDQTTVKLGKEQKLDASYVAKYVRIQGIIPSVWVRLKHVGHLLRQSAKYPPPLLA